MSTKPDTGWAWIVLMSGTLCYCLIIGMVSSYGIYFVTFAEVFQTSRQEAALVASVMYGMICGSGPISSILYQRFGARETVMFGSVFTSLGYLACYFCNSIITVVICHAVIGLGLGLAFVSVLSVLNEYFDKHRHLALGFVSIGGGVGVFIFPPLFQYLIDTFTWRGSMLINAGITAQMCIFGATMRPNQKRTQKKLHQICNCRLFSDFRLSLFIVSCFCWAGAGNIYYQLTNAMAISHAIEKHSTPWIVSVCGVADMIGRSSATFINSLKCANKFMFYSFALCLVSIAVFLNSIAYNMTTFFLVSALFGYGFGALIASFAVSTYQIFGLDNFPSAQGFAQLLSGMGGLTGPVLAAKLSDIYDLETAFRFGSGLGIFGVVCCSLILIDACARK